MNKENAQDNVDNIVYDLNSLYSAFLAAKKDSDWKPQVQKYEIDFLPNIVSTKDLLRIENIIQNHLLNLLSMNVVKFDQLQDYKCLTE